MATQAAWATRSSSDDGRQDKILQLELAKRRNRSNVFQGKHGFITPRDLLRWAGRNPRTSQELAEEGFMLLAERLRRPLSHRLAGLSIRNLG